MKSNVSDYLEMMETVYKDATIKCTADVSDLRDLETLRSRVKDEGLSFLTITLPGFCRDFERSLSDQVIDPSAFSGFRRVKGGSIPAFLQGMIGQIFNRETGRMVLNEDTSTTCRSLSSDFPTIVESVRQICLTFKKVELPCTPNRVQGALDNFVATEQHLQSFSTPNSEYSKFLEISDMLWGNLVTDFSVTECIPKHGPGATAERISGNRKYRWLVWHDRLEPYFPLIDNGYPLGTPSDSEELKNVSIVLEEEELPVRVVLVPKTLKSPRVIAIEPSCMQFVQHGIQAYLYRKLGSYDLTSGHINFYDQSINQKLAIESSKTGLLATIDLSDASDRVPRSLALEMFRCNPDLRDSIDACRSTHASLPDGRLVGPLYKFASMGSALCFPVEAMYFYTICVMALLEGTGLSCSRKNLWEVSRELYVFGDDIVVPTRYADVVLDYLQKYNCKVNVNKTFVSGSFRESCGVDAFRGYPVTPVYLRKERPENKQQAERIVSWVATSNQFYKKGYWRTAQLMYTILESIIGNLPYVTETSSALGRISYLGYESVERWNRNLQRFEIKALVPSPVVRTDLLDGYGALTKCFLGMLTTPEKEMVASQVGSQLELTALHGAVALKRRWVTAH